MRRLVVLGAIAVLSGCGAADGATAQATRSFALSGFDGVRLGGSDDVRVVRGAVFAVVATGPQKELDRLDIRTEGTVLVVARKPSTSIGWQFNKGVRVTVTMPAIRTASVSGSGDIAIDRVDGVRFEGSATGSGDMALASVEVASLRLEATGSGSITAAGRARTIAFAARGSGDIDARRLTGDTVDASVQGSGSVRANARTSAALSVSGSGSATVAGTMNCAITKRGSGSATCTG